MVIEAVNLLMPATCMHQVVSLFSEPYHCSLTHVWVNSLTLLVTHTLVHSTSYSHRESRGTECNINGSLGSVQSLKQRVMHG